MRLKKEEDTTFSWLTNGGRSKESGESGGEQKVHFNPLQVGLKKIRMLLLKVKEEV